MSLFRKKTTQEWLDEEDANLAKMIEDLNSLNSKTTELIPALRILKKARKEKIGQNVHARVLDVIRSVEELFGLTQNVRKAASNVNVDEKYTANQYYVEIYYPNGRLVKGISLGEGEMIQIDRTNIPQLPSIISGTNLALERKNGKVRYAILALNPTLVYSGNLDTYMSYEEFKRRAHRDHTGPQKLDVQVKVYMWDSKPTLAFSYEVLTSSI